MFDYPVHSMMHACMAREGEVNCRLTQRIIMT
jgi:hypothetical protein